MRPPLTALLALALAAPGGAQELGRKGITTKTSFLLPDKGYNYTLEDPDDRRRLRALFHERTVTFANSFVRSLGEGQFRGELERVAEIGGGQGAASQEKLYDFLENLEPIDTSGAEAGTLPPEEELKLKKIQLAWALVQMIRYGAPGFRTTFEVPGQPGGFEEFLEGAQLDKEFLARVKAYEDRYESFIEVSKDGIVPGSASLTQDQILDAMFAIVKDIFESRGNLAPGTSPPETLLRDFARAIVEKYLTDPDGVWRIAPSWYGFSGTSPEVVERTGENFMSSGMQIIAYSMPRVSFDDPEAAVTEMGKAYQIDFKFAGWTRPGGPGSDFSSGSWAMEGDTSIRYSTDPSLWTTGPGPDVDIMETVRCETVPIPMQILDQSLTNAGLAETPDELSIEELFKSYWKVLEAFDNPPTDLPGVGSSLDAPQPPPEITPVGRFSGGTSGGSFP